MWSLSFAPLVPLPALIGLAVLAALAAGAAIVLAGWSAILRALALTVLTIALADPSLVFEDREPRIADINGDGQDEIIVVRSYLRQGAALAIIAVRGNGLEIIAETPPIGEHFRWLNPAGIADFDGDGKPDVALVRMPHTHGELEVWTLRDDKLVRTYRDYDVSNHAVRGVHFKLSAVADFDGDGLADLAIPSFDRRSLRVLGFRNGRVREIDRIALPAGAAEDFELVQRHGRTAVRVGLNGGRSVVVTP